MAAFQHKHKLKITGYVLSELWNSNVLSVHIAITPNCRRLQALRKTYIEGAVMYHE